jgi:hypothetical protein
MPHYFFHINHTHQRVEDPEGADFEFLEVAHQEAAAALRDLIAAALKDGKPSTLEAIDVADHEGSVLATVHLLDATEPIFNFRRHLASGRG